MIQFLFAFIIGLVLGLVTVKTESIVPAILIHMFNNGMSAFQDILKYAVGEKISENSLVVLFIFWIVTGAIAGLYLLFKGELKKGNDSTTYDGVLSFRQRIGAFLFPGMIVPFILLILITCTTVSKI